VCYSCQFHGTASELAAHVEHCQYEAMKHYIHQTDGRFTELVQTLKQKDQEINFLRVMLGNLSTKVKSLEKTVEGTHVTMHVTQQSIVLISRLSLLSCHDFHVHFFAPLCWQLHLIPITAESSIVPSTMGLEHWICDRKVACSTLSQSTTK